MRLVSKRLLSLSTHCSIYGWRLVFWRTFSCFRRVSKCLFVLFVGRSVSSAVRHRLFAPGTAILCTPQDPSIPLRTSLGPEPNRPSNTAGIPVNRPRDTMRARNYESGIPSCIRDIAQRHDGGKIPLQAQNHLWRLAIESKDEKQHIGPPEPIT